MTGEVWWKTGVYNLCKTQQIVHSSGDGRGAGRETRTRRRPNGEDLLVKTAKDVYRLLGAARTATSFPDVLTGMSCAHGSSLSAMSYSLCQHLPSVAYHDGRTIHDWIGQESHEILLPS